MTKIIFVLICALLFALTMAANTGISSTGTGTRGSMTSAASQDTTSEEYDDLDIDLIMKECNESFITEMSYLESLNVSGSFVDETDRTPKCFIRCLLMKLGVVSQDGVFNPDIAAVIYSGERNGKPMDDISEMTSTCATKRNEPCLCDRAYQFMRCLMSMEIEKYGPTRQ